jgi:transcriptional regulator with XRE-family HTH domain
MTGECEMYYDIVMSGDRIRQLRKHEGITQEQLAIKLHISDRYLRKIETGEKGPSIDILVEISALFGVSLDYIVMGRQPQDSLKQKLHSVIQNLSALAEEL